MEGVQIVVYGLKLLISFSCFGATFYQSFVLFNNFKSKDTLRKNSEIYYPGNYTTPMIIVCSDPGSTEPEEPLIELDEINFVSGIIPRIKTFQTVYKGVCSILDSFTMPPSMVEGSLMFKFNSTKKLVFYSLFPGQKMFLSVYHPSESLEGRRVEGSTMFKLSLIPKVTSLLSEHGYCKAIDDDDFISFSKALKEYDYCLAQEMMKKAAQELNITYHPILDNFHEFDNLPRTVFNESLKFYFAGSLMTGYTICKKPCVTVEYKMTLDKFSMTPEEIIISAGGPNRGTCWVQLGRFVQFEVEDYIVKSVDLLSGLGGAMGLWLGWSALSLGNSIVKAFRTFTSVKLFK